MTWQIATFDLFDSGIDSTLSNSTNSTVTDLMQISSSFYLLQMGKAVHPIKQSDGMKLKQYCSFMHAQVTCSYQVIQRVLWHGNVICTTDII